MSINSLQQVVRQFAEDRDWGQFHTPRNLVLALCGEAGELAELLQWTADADINSWLADAKNKERLRHEMADILSYLLRLSDVCGVDLEQALLEKTELNETRYPVELAKGSAQKYTQLGGSDS